jgi:8-oxo-dGTP diphosphatase
MSRSCNLTPTINGKKGAVYAVIDGKAVRLTRERLLSGELPENLEILYGVSGHVRVEPGTTVVKTVGGSGSTQALAAQAQAAGVNVAAVTTAQHDDEDVESCSNDWCFSKTDLVEAADAVIIRQGPNGPEVLMIERKHGPFKNALSLPGGLRDTGESLFEAAAREMAEEVGIASRAASPLGVIDSRDWDPRFAAGVRVGAVRYAVDGSIEYEATDDALAASWISLEEIASGRRAVAFGHATWLAAAFSDDPSLAQRMNVIAEASRVRNQRVISKIQQRRAAAGAMQFSELGNPHAPQQVRLEQPARAVPTSPQSHRVYTSISDARADLKAKPQSAPRKVDIARLASGYEFVETRKQPKEYVFSQAPVGELPPMSYTVAQQKQTVVTITADGIETQNTAEAGDVIMSGPSGENYVVKAAKFAGLYDGEPGGTVIPNQTPRMVTRYTGSSEVVFTASWGEDMVLKPGDYLVGDPSGVPYRIAKAEFEETYNEVRLVI